VKLAELTATKAEARKALEALKAGDGPSGGLTTWEAVSLFLAAQEARLARGEILPRRMQDLEWFLASFGAAVGTVPFDGLRKHHLIGWLDGQKGWGQSTRNLGAKIVKQAYRWALDMGHADCPDALAKLRMPAIKRREQVPDRDAVARMMASQDGQEWRNVIRFMDLTACRPNEVCTLHATHIDWAARVAWVLDKNRRKTGRERRPVYCGPEAMAILREQAALHPEGPVFRNERGGPWRGNTIRKILLRAGAQFPPYSLRHARITDMVEKIGLLKASVLAGHGNLKTTLGYSHATTDADALRHAAELAQGSGSTGPASDGDKPGPATSSSPPGSDAPDTPARRPRGRRPAS
jgi:integrase